MNADERRLDGITEKIIGCAFQVANVLGSGFLGKVYENALAVELRKAELEFAQQKPIRILYDGQIVGDYVVDLLVEGEIVVELKAIKILDEIHMAQCLNYLKATNLKVCLLVNFGRPRIQIKRIVNNF